MWSQWTERAKSSFTEALDKTGDAISKAATQTQKQSLNINEAAGGVVNTFSTFTKKISTATTTTDESNNSNNNSSSSSSNTKPAVAVGRYANETTTTTSAQQQQQQQPEMMLQFQKGWSNMVETTKQSVKKAQEVVEREQSRIQQEMKRRELAKKRRDINLPLDVPALKDAQVVYVTDRIITMSHPAIVSTVHPNEISAQRKLAAVGHMLQRRHAGKYMVWNLSEMEYDTQLLNDQVLTFSFPGSPAPSLGLWLKLLISIESWMNADRGNIAVLHCLTGKGRTSTVLAAFLTWMGQARFQQVFQALDYIAMCKHIQTEELTIPSQRRYASYFENMMDGIRPNQPPLIIKRILLSQAPKFAKGPPRGENNNLDNKKGTKSNKNNREALMGCAPYLQIFKAGKLIFATAASLSYAKEKKSSNDLKFCYASDGTVTFHLDQVVQGDILIRCRHWNPRNKSRISLFRAAFHTGYCPSKVFRLTKSQLDGACTDDRFSDDFYLDMMLEPCDAERAAEHLKHEQEQEEEELRKQQQEQEGGDENEKKMIDRTKVVVTACSDDEMLHRDSRFWDVIAQHREKKPKEGEEEDSNKDDEHKEQPTQAEKKNDPMWGPTIGRRRNFPKLDSKLGGNKGDDGGAEPATEKEASAFLQTFSIGGELDFLPSDNEGGAKAPAPTPTNPIARITGDVLKTPKRDSLMEALMALDQDEEENHTNEVEEIVFDSAAEDTETDDGGSSKNNEASSVSTAGTGNKSNAASPAAPSSATTSNVGNGETAALTKTTTTTGADGGSSANDSNENTKAAATTNKEGKQEQPIGVDNDEKQETTAGESMSEMDELLNADLDPNMDELLAGTETPGEDVDGVVDDGDLDFDAEMEDLENFLTK